MKDTIAAIATPSGAGGIAVVRISGKGALTVLNKIFTPNTNKPLKERYLHLGWVGDTEPIDQVLAFFMKEPNTYTGEDVVEIQCHGGKRVATVILDLILRWGPRLAEPGEFTKRAFLNGKIDLSEAEAIADMIHASGEQAVRLSARALSGRQSKKTTELQEQLLLLIARLEANADYPEDDTDYELEQQRNELNSVITQLQSLIKRTSVHAYDGISLCIAGEPNVGKSSLLNRLSDSDRAIVSDIPGTTRDVVEAMLEIEGISVRVSDTAGIRISDDPLETIGVERARREIDTADLVLFVFDGAKELTDSVKAEVAQLKGKEVLPVVNKADIALTQDFAEITELMGKEPLVISALTGQGMNQLRQIIKDKANKLNNPEDIIFHRQRQISALNNALAALESAKGAFGIMPPECVLVDLKTAWRELGLISGQTADERVIDMIFSTFCLGK